LVLPSSGVFSLAGSFRCLFLLLFLGALYLLGSFFTWVYFLLEPFFLNIGKKQETGGWGSPGFFTASRRLLTAGPLCRKFRTKNQTN
jgi:hypothetical protein